MTVITKARLTATVPEPEEMPANPAKNATPVTYEYHAHAGFPCLANRRPTSTHAVISARNPTPPHTRCRPPCQVIGSGAPAGAPIGNPFIGSATNTPAPIIPVPNVPTSRAVHFEPIARRNPTAA